MVFAWLIFSLKHSVLLLLFGVVFGKQIQDLFKYLDKYSLELDEYFEEKLSRHHKTPRKQWSKFVTPENTTLISREALDLLDGLLRYDHQERLSPTEAMQHSYFDPIRKQQQERQTPPPS